MTPSFFKNLGPFSAESIFTTIDCKPLNIEKDYSFKELVGIFKKSKNSISFIYDNENNNFTPSKDAAIVCSKKKSTLFDDDQKLIIVKDVQQSVATLSNFFYRDYINSEIEKFEEPSIGDNCEIGKNVIIENGVILGKNVKISHGSIIKHSCIIGDYCTIGSNSVISNSIIGKNTFIENNCSLGQPGFGFHMKNFSNLNIYHIGRVILKDNVRVGSGCAIDKGSFSDTVIGNNTYLDNLCHIAHNVQIGNNCALAAMTGIAGSTKIGNNVLTGGQAGIAGHLNIGNNVQIAAKSGVLKSLSDNEFVMGYPAIKKSKFMSFYRKLYGK